MERREKLLSELLDRLSQGDTDAAAQLFLEYTPYLRKVIRRQLPARLRRKLDSSDILQSAWTDVLERLGQADWKFETPAQLQAFLVRVMRNRCIDRCRQHRKPLELETALGDMDSTSVPPSFLADPGAAAQANELWDRLLALCPAEHRDVLRLKRDGATAQEIAEQTGLHEGSIRRILRQLASRLAGTNAEQPEPDQASSSED